VESDGVNSYWHESVTSTEVERDSLNSDIDLDIAIVGAGYSGLWTAYYLKKLQPDVRVAVIESNYVGYGASGRNGGWCSGFLPMTLAEIEKQHNRQAAIEMYSQSFATIDEIEKTLKSENIDCDFHRGGTIHGATNAVQHSRVLEEVKKLHSYGFSEDDSRMLTSVESRAKINIPGLLAASYTPHCATIHPKKLVLGLAKVVERMGVKIYENSRVNEINPHLIKLENTTVRADVVVRATEGFTSQIKRHRRTLAPLYSYMVATEPLTKSQRDEISWQNRETYHDARNMIIYVQITRDGRIAFGGRGAPYHFGSRVKASYDNHDEIHQRIISSMHKVFPVTKNLEVTNRWGGPLGVPRDWQPSVNFDQRSGLASLGGYVGDGVAATNLAARTLAHLMVGDDHSLTNLPWVNHPSRKWEVEPLRYLGINGLLRLSNSMDKHENKRGTVDKFRANILDRFI
jgi:glycine/D-amino acid oxidase-like deaminating enzyme